ncbi:MAG: AsmA-like C-terminal region-containing protein [bacterium]|nr:AsmA-like C-terminal region-containing protein [bacterium]
MAMTLKIVGDVGGTFSLLNHPRFDLVSDLGIPFEKASGQVEIDLKLDFPLEMATTVDQVEAQAQASIKKLSLEGLSLGGGKDFFSATSEKLSISLKERRLAIKGPCIVAGAPSHLSFHKSFQKKVRQFGLETENAKKLLEGLGVEWEKKIPEGEVKLSFVHTENSRDFQQILVKADLSKAAVHIPILGISKPLKEKGSFSGVFEKKEGKSWDIKELLLDLGTHGKIQGRGAYGDKGLEFLKLQGKPAGKHVGTLTVRQGPQGYHASLNAQSLDLFSLLQGYEEMAKEDSIEDSLPSLPIHFLISADVLKISGKPIARDLKGSFQGTLNRLDYGTLEAKNLQDEKPFLKVTLAPEKDGQKTLLKLKARKAGELLKSLGAEGIEGGTLVLKATRDNTSAGGDWVGRLFLKNFVATDMPEMIKVLHLASPLGIFEFFSEGTSLRFEEAKVDVRFEKDKIVLAEGRASGSEIGFTMSGTVDLAKERLSVEGSIIPASFFNTLISYIPILGELLMGGEGEGIFGISYSIRGPFGDTKASINPLSILTPGFLRKIFGS